MGRSSVRCGPSARLIETSIALRMQVQAPTLALVPITTRSGGGLTLSALAHAGAICAMLTWFPVVAPRRPAMVERAAAYVRREPTFQVVMLPALPPIEDPHAPGDPWRSASHFPMPDFAGPQEIVSDFPNARKGVQTIRRPDLVAPPKLANPIRLESRVTLPAPAVLAPVMPSPEVQAPQIPRDLPTLPVTGRRLEIAEVPVVAPARLLAASLTPATQTSSETDPEANASRAVVVVNAVSVPPEPLPVVPETELLANFVVAASKNVPAKDVAMTSSAGPIGISISGGIPGRSVSTSAVTGRAGAAGTIASGSYGLTIVSGGSNGGATRDLGVFSRSDTIYTVYIPMTDAGGGPEWPIQYALVSASLTSHGLPTPPTPLKKVRATAPGSSSSQMSHGLVFVTGIIDETGKLRGLRAIRAMDVRAESAVAALTQWEFLPAQLDGKPVSSRVLIGVEIVPAEEATKQE